MYIIIPLNARTKCFWRFYMTKKSLLTLVWAIFLVLMLAACGNDKKEESEITDTDNTDTVTDTADSCDTETSPDEDNADSTDSCDTETVTDDDNTDAGWETKYQKADESAEKVSEDVVKANNRFGMKIFSRLAKEEGAKNIMISPLSISIAMAMTANGAVDEALSEMKEVLGFGNMNMPDVNEQFEQLIASLVEADKYMTLEIADSLWLDERFAPDVKDDFISVLEDYYSAALFTEDFADPATADKINSWVSEKTHEKIGKIIGEIGANTVMYIINAVYFKAGWTHPFAKGLTYSQKFQLSDGNIREADLMHAGGDTYTFKIVKENYSVVRIPYGRGVFAFYAIVPSGNVDDFIDKIAQDDINSCFESLRESFDFSLGLPKFRFAYEKSLKDTFKTLGMERIFAGGLENISSNVENLHISNIFHKTFIEVDEEGTEAAAVTADSADTGEDYTPPSVFADRPFVFVIRDERTGSILFVGKVEDPTAE